MEKSESLKLDMDSKDEIQSIIYQLKAIQQMIDSQHSLVNEYKWRLLARNVKNLDGMFQRVFDCLDSAICVIGDIISELEKLFQQ
jgi:hypothetical protein